MAQVTFIIIYAFTAEYDTAAGPTDKNSTVVPTPQLKDYYPSKLFSPYSKMIFYSYQLLLST